MSDLQNTLSRLMSVIEDRRQNMPEGSYTTKLFEGGNPKIGKKILEEAAEVVEAAGESGEEGRAHLIYEAGDLLYFLLVMLGYHRISIEEVLAELVRREGVSGLVEKASRQQPKTDN